jgi:4-diphosphocytidyl-2-C-methyl-D-erythritol kinase
LTDVSALRIEAPAKVNLYLHVTGRRADGYHLLDSLVAFAEIGDTLDIELAGELTLINTGPFGAVLDPGPDNLVLRAARSLAAEAGVHEGARLTLTKRVPVAAGLGGGSADAAATLEGLADLWDLDVSDEDLARLGVDLGADVPVCLYGGPAYVSGIGETIEAAPRLPETHLVLANPGKPVLTAAVYKAQGGRFAPAARFADAPADARALAELLARRENGLARAAIEIEPSISNTLAALDATTGCLLSRLCGSGPTCYGLFADARAAEAAAAALRVAHPDWWVTATRLLR